MCDVEDVFPFGISSLVNQTSTSTLSSGRESSGSNSSRLTVIVPIVMLVLITLAVALGLVWRKQRRDTGNRANHHTMPCVMNQVAAAAGNGNTLPEAVPIGVWSGDGAITSGRCVEITDTNLSWSVPLETLGEHAGAGTPQPNQNRRDQGHHLTANKIITSDGYSVPREKRYVNEDVVMRALANPAYGHTDAHGTLVLDRPRAVSMSQL